MVDKSEISELSGKVGAALKKLREDRQLSPEQVEASVRASGHKGLSASYLRRLEKGGQNATLRVIGLALAVYGVKMADFFIPLLPASRSAEDIAAHADLQTVLDSAGRRGEALSLLSMLSRDVVRESHRKTRTAPEVQDGQKRNREPARNGANGPRKRQGGRRGAKNGD